MKDKITVITAIRNREAWRIRTMVESIRKSGADPSFHIVDYGSTAEYASEYETLCKELKIKYTHMYSEGLPWNKCRALNFGAKKATTPYIVTSDVDMLYLTNAFEWCLKNLRPKTFFNIPTYWLNESKEFDKATPAGKGNPGGFVFSSKEVFSALNGYDERYVYWGTEDIDWVRRLTILGYKQIWLPEEYKIYHQWHPKSESGNLRPACAESDSRRYFYENMANPVLKQNWGKPLTKKDRPILDYIQNNTPFEFSIGHGEISDRDTLNQLINNLKLYKFIKLDLSPRIKPSKFGKFQNKFSNFFQKTCLKGTGLICIPEVNNNFDFLYSIIKSLQWLGLRDYYFSNDIQIIYLLWK